MLRGLYTGALGLSALNKQQELVANNLANANSLGYKKDRVVTGSFHDMLIQRLHDPLVPADQAQVGTISTGVKIAAVVTDYSGGVQRNTGDPLSLAVRGDGYFTVNTPQGERYTKNGDFRLDISGRLATGDGYPVMGKNGEIVLLGKDFSINEIGDVFVGGKKADTLKIVNLTAPQKEGASLFKADNPQEPENVSVVQNFEEESNVNPIEEMNTLLSVMRAYESNQKAIQTHDSTLEKAVNEIAAL